MKKRVSGSVLGLIKSSGETRALDRCLGNRPEIQTVCDAPSGPGRMFPYWKKNNYAVYAVDVSENMVAASRKAGKDIGVQGKVEMGDVFKLDKILEKKPDLVACIRFVYYFGAKDRARLLRSLAEASNRYVLVQYKTADTIKGQINQVRRTAEGENPKRTHLEQRAVSYNDMIRELREAGLNPLQIEPIGEFSDRVFVLAEKRIPPGNQIMESQTPGASLKKPRRLYLAAPLLAVFALIYFMNADRGLMGEAEAFLSLGARSVLKGDGIPRGIHHHPFWGTREPMIWWIAAVSAPFSGVTERSARFAHVLVMAGALYAIYAFSRRHKGRATGILTILILGTSYGFWENASGIGSEMLLTLSLTVSWGALFTLLNSSFRWKFWWLLWGGLSIGLFLIGPLALELTVVLFAVFAFSSWKPKEAWKRLARVRPLSGLLLCFAPFLLWTSFVFSRHGSEWGRTLFLNLNPGLLMNCLESHENTLHRYLSVFPANLLPWSLLLPFVAWRLIKQRKTQKESPSGINRFALFACATILVFFSFISQTGCHLLPLIPWAAFLTGDYIWRRLSNIPRLSSNDSDEERLLLGRLLGLRSGRILVSVFAFLMAGLALFNGILTHHQEGQDCPRIAAEKINFIVDADDRLILVDIADPRIMFYIRKKFEVSDDDEDSIRNLENILKSEQDTDLLVEDHDLYKFIKSGNPAIYVEGRIKFQNKVYYIITNDYRPGLEPLSNFAYRRPA